MTPEKCQVRKHNYIKEKIIYYNDTFYPRIEFFLLTKKDLIIIQKNIFIFKTSTIQITIKKDSTRLYEIKFNKN